MEFLILSILVVVCYVSIVRWAWVIRDKIDLLEYNLKEITESQSSIREAIDKIEMYLYQIDCTLIDIEDDINELKK